jgi:hypothetical protein
MANKRVGGEVDAACGKCKMTLAHTILAMVGEKVVRVQCNTCGSPHNYKSPAGSASAPRAPRAAASGGSRAKGGAAAVSKITVTFDQLMAQKDAGAARRYSPKDTYAAEDVIDHPSFGFGIVTAVRSDKVDVMFKSSEKTLVHGRGGGPTQKPAFERPRPASTGPADKPQQAANGAPDEASAPADAPVEEG